MSDLQVAEGHSFPPRVTFNIRKLKPHHRNPVTLTVGRSSRLFSSQVRMTWSKFTGNSVDDLPLSGTRALELGQDIAGPLQTAARCPLELDAVDVSQWFRSLGRDKSVAVDVGRKDEGREFTYSDQEQCGTREFQAWELIVPFRSCGFQGCCHAAFDKHSGNGDWVFPPPPQFFSRVHLCSRRTAFGTVLPMPRQRMASHSQQKGKTLDVHWVWGTVSVRMNRLRRGTVWAISSTILTVGIEIRYHLFLVTFFIPVIFFFQFRCENVSAVGLSRTEVCRKRPANFLSLRGLSSEKKSIWDLGGV
ncbi:hypothetical protein EDC04DRAFT_3006126 [Pisolithus marmoratus]|nr:hypothetical protein EDC04DRAFT_3006126 [Pisolithus marmoratus]